MLSDLQVFSEFVYSAQQEVLAQQIALFNAASRGTIALAAGPIQGDFHTEAFWARIHGLVRRRNPYNTGTVAAKELSMLTDVMVKVAAGTPPIDIPPSQFRWIQQNPEEGGALIGRQLAVDTLADMLNTALMATVAALIGETEIVVDISGTGAGTMTHPVFNTAQALFGDEYQNIAAWVMHSKPLFDIYADAMANSHFLFNFGNVRVQEDAFGRAFVITDSPSLVNLLHTPDDLDPTLVVPSPVASNRFYSLGLTKEAVRVDQQADFDDNISTLNGDENIKRTYQAEWSYALGVKGFKWDTTNGGHAPSDAAIATGTNWDRYATSPKHLAGVMVKSK